jgi:hypothetical protein
MKIFLTSNQLKAKVRTKAEFPRAKDTGPSTRITMGDLPIEKKAPEQRPEEKIQAKKGKK